jgi:hypothetical protein
MKTMSNYNGHEIKDAVIPDGAIVMGRVDIVMYMDADGQDVVVSTRTDDGHGNRLTMVNSLGMIEMAKKVIFDMGGQAEWVEDKE